MPGSLGRFLPGEIGANHCRLRHIGWGKCSHGLSSRPRETSSVWFLDELLVLFGYPSASGASLLAGTLPLRFFSESFARRIPTWRLPEGGTVPSFLASRGLVWGGPSALSSALGGAGVYLGSGSGGDVKRVRLYRKTPAHLARQGFSGVHARPRFGSDFGVLVQILVCLVPSFCGFIRKLVVMSLVLHGRELAEAGDCTSPRLQVLA